MEGTPAAEQPQTTSEYRIRSTTEGGYWSGKRDGFTTLDQAQRALRDYHDRVQRDTFISHETRQRHLASLVIETRDVTDWRNTTDPGAPPLPTPHP